MNPKDALFSFPKYIPTTGMSNYRGDEIGGEVGDSDKEEQKVDGGTKPKNSRSQESISIRQSDLKKANGVNCDMCFALKSDIKLVPCHHSYCENCLKDFFVDSFRKKVSSDIYPRFQHQEKNKGNYQTYRSLISSSNSRDLVCPKCTCAIKQFKSLSLLEHTKAQKQKSMTNIELDSATFNTSDINLNEENMEPNKPNHDRKDDSHITGDPLRMNVKSNSYIKKFSNWVNLNNWFGGKRSNDANENFVESNEYSDSYSLHRSSSPSIESVINKPAVNLKKQNLFRTRSDCPINLHKPSKSISIPFYVYEILEPSLNHSRSITETNGGNSSDKTKVVSWEDENNFTLPLFATPSIYYRPVVQKRHARHKSTFSRPTEYPSAMTNKATDNSNCNLLDKKNIIRL